MRLSGTSFRLRGVPVGMLIVSLAVLLRAQPTTRGDLPPTMDPQEIVRRSLEIDNRTAELARNYTYQHRDVRKHLGLHGEVKAVAVKTWDVTNLYGEPYSRLIQKDDKPLSAKEQKRRGRKTGKIPQQAQKGERGRSAETPSQGKEGTR